MKIRYRYFFFFYQYSLYSVNIVIYGLFLIAVKFHMGIFNSLFTVLPLKPTVYPRDTWMNTANQWPFSSPFPSTSRISRQPKQAVGAGPLWPASSAWDCRLVVAGAIQLHEVARGGGATFSVSSGPPFWTATAALYELLVGWPVQRRDAAYSGRRPVVAGA
jgi:hypothetical protein